LYTATSLKRAVVVEEEYYVSGAAVGVTGRKVWVKVETQGEGHLAQYMGGLHTKRY
jgi:hypothetical protein